MKMIFFNINRAMPEADMILRWGGCLFSGDITAACKADI